MSKNIYPSRYSNGKLVSPAQYITEIICENKAKLDKIDLHYRFWVTPKWSSYYRNQIASANKLLEKYSAKAIIKALSDSKASKIYSLRAPHLIAIIDHYEKLVESENTDFKLEINRSEEKTHRQEKSTKNILSKLKELDNG
jgi:hypothetical protein